MSRLANNIGISGSRVILTGAAGGLGSEIARQLITHNCQIGLVGRNQHKLEKLAANLIAQGGDVIVIAADITQENDRDIIINSMLEKYKGIDILVNNAAVMSFSLFENQRQDIEKIFTTNVMAPMHLCHKVLPQLSQSSQPYIVNIGSTFGSIAFACFSSYSASKFALRGFTESLRRELADSSINVCYYAPRAVKTSLNTDKIMQMAEKTNMAMDPPDKIARKIVDAMVKGKKELYLGFPEAFFVKLNALFPRLVDIGISAQSNIMKQFCG